MLWLTHETTGTLAPIDLSPADGGNALVPRDRHGIVVGTYRVELPRRELDVELDAGEGTLLALLPVPAATRPPEDAAPRARTVEFTRHYVHHATCRSATGRRLARERAAARRAGEPVVPGRLRTVDGDPVGPATIAEQERGGEVARLAPGQRRCRRCFQPIPVGESNGGARYHATCDPRGGFS